MNSNKVSIAFIGSGNVATKLAMSLYQKDVCITQVYSKTMDNAKTLANSVNAEAINSISQISDNNDIIIISISDNALKELDFSNLPKQAIVCHTSGSVGLEVINSCNNYGVFYPLQTFTKDTEVDITEVPFCIEANNPKNLEILISLASRLSKNVSEVNSQERAKMHLAAVFACNFTNAMYSIAEDLMLQSNLNFDYLRPLIKETAAKTISNSPQEIQTGPAVRNDRNIIDKHISDLHNNNDYKDLYALMSKIIYKNTNKI